MGANNDLLPRIMSMVYEGKSNLSDEKAIVAVEVLSPACTIEILEVIYPIQGGIHMMSLMRDLRRRYEREFLPHHEMLQIRDALVKVLGENKNIWQLST